MRSLGLKLTLAFLLVAILGVGLVAVLVGLRTMREFDQFVNDRFQSTLVEQLTDYYADNGSWRGLSGSGNRRMGLRILRTRAEHAGITLLDANKQVVFTNLPRGGADALFPNGVYREVALQVAGQIVGWLHLNLPPDNRAFMADSPELDFLQRVRLATVYSAIAAGLLALILGWLLARAISRPVSELTVATRAVAQGQLGLQVAVRSNDEIGQLASSFNQMSADLARATKVRRQMTADIAHDLRTPLSVILGYTEALSEGKLPGDAEIYETLYSEAKLLNHLIDDLRTLSLADANELPLNLVEVAPVDILQRAAAAQQIHAQQAGITLGVSTSEDLPPIRVDPERLAQIMGNLISNAIRYTPQGGTIRLSAEAQGNRVAIRVQDNGAGIATDDLPHIFDRFYRGDKSRQNTGESGLGLAIAKSIVEAMGGSISVESKVGEGSTFTVLLSVRSILDASR